MILNGSKTISNVLKRVYNWTSEIVGRVSKILSACSVMWLSLDSVEDWVSETLDQVFHVKLSSHAPIRCRLDNNRSFFLFIFLLFLFSFG